ncbi:hypothetical protein [Ferroacidibacillus organovorans]|nr:hypothetical protein [Ferroacidibacillus organovorans]
MNAYYHLKNVGSTQKDVAGAARCAIAIDRCYTKENGCVALLRAAGMTKE